MRFAAREECRWVRAAVVLVGSQTLSVGAQYLALAVTFGFSVMVLVITYVVGHGKKRAAGVCMRLGVRLNALCSVRRVQMGAGGSRFGGVTDSICGVPVPGPGL